MSDKPRLDKIYQQTIMLDFPTMPPRVEYHKQNAINLIIANLGFTTEQLSKIEIVSSGQVIEDKIYIDFVLAWQDPLLCNRGEFLWTKENYAGAALEIPMIGDRDGLRWRRYLKRLLVPVNRNPEGLPPYYWERVI
jgi:hypothetical protein